LKIIRVFPHRTKATPTDELAIIGEPDMLSEADCVHISVTFTWDMQEAERLYDIWKHRAPTEIGGPATGAQGGNFTPGMYLKKGYVITSRGCPNQCWFCSVWKREGGLRELPITEGFNVLDDNLLSCSDKHIKDVFNMLSKQKERPQFTGGLEPKRLKQWHIDELIKLKTERMYFAYDGPEDREPMYEAGKLLKENNITLRSRVPCAYCLIGYPKDTFENAEKRLIECLDFGFMPMAMLYRDEKGEKSKEWADFQRVWARPTIIWSNYKNYFEKESCMSDYDTWGNLRGEPVRIIDEAHGSNFVKVFIYKTGDLFAYGFQLRVGTVIRQKAANIGGATFNSEGAAREAAGVEIAAICATNKNSKKYFAEFAKVRYNNYDLFSEVL